MLLRATQLGVSEGHGTSTGQLSLDPALHEQWRQLNSTERYFNLLEAWLRIGRWEMTGFGGGGWMNYVSNARDLWRAIPSAGQSFSGKESRRGEFLYCVEQLCTLALLEMFGLMTVEREEPDEGQSWRVAAVHHLPFGDELLAIVFEQIHREMFADNERDLEFGAWQPVLQPHFPQWINNLVIPEAEFRDGVYYFKVSLGKPWRRIALPAESDLDDLAQWIIRAFEFDGDHLYDFQFAARDGHQIRVQHPYVDDAIRFTPTKCR